MMLWCFCLAAAHNLLAGWALLIHNAFYRRELIKATTAPSHLQFEQYTKQHCAWCHRQRIVISIINAPNSCQHQRLRVGVRFNYRLWQRSSQILTFVILIKHAAKIRFIELTIKVVTVRINSILRNFILQG